MESIFDYLEFVKDQESFHDRKGVELQGDKRGARHKSTAEKFRGLRQQIEMLASATILRQVPGANPLALTAADVKDLPPELLDQLVNLPESDKLETDIVEIINESGGTLLLDHLIITLYKRTGEIHQRSTLVSKMYRMNKKGLVFGGTKKGVYTTVRPTEEVEGGVDEHHEQLDLTVEGARP